MSTVDDSVGDTAGCGFLALPSQKIDLLSLTLLLKAEQAGAAASKEEAV